MKRLQGGVVSVVVCAAMAVMILLSAKGLGAQPGPAFTRPVYQYVGINQTIARVEQATGRIEILEQRDAPGLSLVHVQSRPWEWREIRIRKERDRRRGSVRTPKEADESGRERHP
ncbi:MAG: hypothetical protein ACE5EC_05965 [Phycisphaerae bacterium]